jgi:hypothetical protein
MSFSICFVDDKPDDDFANRLVNVAGPAYTWGDRCKNNQEVIS